MKLTITILVFLTLNAHAQTWVKATDYIKSLSVVKQDTSVIVKGGGYADYAIKIPKSGVYCFALNVLNDVGTETTVKIKTPTGSTILGTASIPLNSQYQTVCVNVKLSTVSTKVRLMFDNAVTLSSFTYNMPGVVSTNYALQSDVDALRQTLDSLKNVIKSNVIKFDPSKFRMTEDSTITTN